VDTLSLGLRQNVVPTDASLRYYSTLVVNAPWLAGRRHTLAGRRHFQKALSEAAALIALRLVARL
jgi:hypothetical protein